MEFKNLIGYTIDTNQFTSNVIESEDDAKIYLKRLISIYNADILNHMFLADFKRITTYKKDGVTLSQILKNNSDFNSNEIKKRASAFWNKLPMFNMDKVCKRTLSQRYFEKEQSFLTIDEIVFIYEIES